MESDISHSESRQNAGNETLLQQASIQNLRELASAEKRSFASRPLDIPTEKGERYVSRAIRSPSDSSETATAVASVATDETHDFQRVARTNHTFLWMELSSAESALRTLTHRPKVPPSAIASAEAILKLIRDPVAILGRNFPPRLVGAGTADLISRWARTLPELNANVDFCLPSPESSLNVSTIAPLSDQFVRQTVKQAVYQYMEYYEPRVRMAVAKVLRVLAKWDLEWITHEFTPKPH
ncbi:hypothetical protein PsorP6_005467 [Peronosclerospora sorghi]|uniref:Uncharacterized protein n=1 Tax=Peronosclerospora sorghi TaxID=230839 RepID=A0ACC0W3S2_9STRA|nr:hypothetical protein PsorP6_005467 [Peronosclerospora sorghi]